MEIKYSPTSEEIADYIKCINSPLYFTTKCFVKTSKGLIQYDKYCKLNQLKKYTIRIEN